MRLLVVTLEVFSGNRMSRSYYRSPSSFQSGGFSTGYSGYSTSANSKTGSFFGNLLSPEDSPARRRHGNTSARSMHRYIPSSNSSYSSYSSRGSPQSSYSVSSYSAARGNRSEVRRNGRVQKFDAEKDYDRWRDSVGRRHKIGANRNVYAEKIAVDLDESKSTEDSTSVSGSSVTESPRSRKMAWPRFTPSKKSAEDYQEQIDSLMSLVLNLQNQGKLDEVAPVMKKIKRLQEKSEKALEEQFRRSGREYNYAVGARNAYENTAEEVEVEAAEEEEELEEEEEEEGINIPYGKVSKRLEKKEKKEKKQRGRTKADLSRETPEEPKSSRGKRVTFSPEVKSRHIPQTIETNIEAYIRGETGMDDDGEVQENEQPEFSTQVDISEMETSVESEARRKAEDERIQKEEAERIRREKAEEDRRFREAEKKRREDEKMAKERLKIQRLAEKRRKKELEKSLAAMGIDVLMLDPPPEENHALKSFKDIQRIARTKGVAKRFRQKVRDRIKKRKEAEATVANPSGQTLQRRMITKSGYMLKAPPQYKRFSRWRKRYFMLSGRLLVYSKHRGSKGSKGIIDLAGAEVEAVVIPSGLRNRGEDTYEVRLHPRGTNRVYRLRPERVKGEGRSQKREARDWAASIRNNIRIADKEGDIRKKNKIRMQSESEKRDKLKQRRLFKRLSSAKTKSYAWEQERDLLQEEEDVRQQKAFRQDNGAPSEIGQDISLTEEDENLQTYYKLLGVIPKATPSMIKKAYRALARDFHPDKNPDADKYKFAEIARAFEVLKDPESRAKYDLCERVKQILRHGVVVRRHDRFMEAEKIVMFTDARFLNLYFQDEEHGTVLAPGYNTIEMRYVTHIYAGTDGFHGFAPPPGRADFCLTIHGERMGYRDLHLELDNARARDELLDGLRLLRCDTSELFKQRLEEMFDRGMR